MDPYRENFGDLSIAFIASLVEAFYARSAALKAVHEHLSKYRLTGWLFGGAIRDMVTAYAAGEEPHPRDLDVIVTGSYDDYQEMLKAIPKEWGVDSGRAIARLERAEHTEQVVYNNDGGSGKDHTTIATIEGATVDLWHISRQRGMNLTSGRIDDVPASTFLTIESIVALVGPHTDVIDAGFIEVMRTRTLGCRPEWRAHIIEPKATFKTLALQARLGFAMTPELHQFVGENAKWMSVQELIDLSRARYGTCVDVPNLLSVVDAAPLKRTLTPAKAPALDEDF